MNVVKTTFYDCFDLKYVDLLDDKESKYFMYKLKCELAMKDTFKDINKNEEELFLIFRLC